MKKIFKFIVYGFAGLFAIGMIGSMLEDDGKSGETKPLEASVKPEKPLS